jgi:hypothetical protein
MSAVAVPMHSSLCDAENSGTRKSTCVLRSQLNYSVHNSADNTERKNHSIVHMSRWEPNIVIVANEAGLVKPDSAADQSDFGMSWDSLRAYPLFTLSDSSDSLESVTTDVETGEEEEYEEGMVEWTILSISTFRFQWRRMLWCRDLFLLLFLFRRRRGLRARPRQMNCSHYRTLPCMLDYSFSPFPPLFFLFFSLMLFLRIFCRLL